MTQKQFLGHIDNLTSINSHRWDFLCDVDDLVCQEIERNKSVHTDQSDLK